jgi:hypothetical protein
MIKMTQQSASLFLHANQYMGEILSYWAFLIRLISFDLTAWLTDNLVLVQVIFEFDFASSKKIYGILGIYLIAVPFFPVHTIEDLFFNFTRLIECCPLAAIWFMRCGQCRQCSQVLFSFQNVLKRYSNLCL